MCLDTIDNGINIRNYKYRMLINDVSIIVKIILLFDLHVLHRNTNKFCHACNIKCLTIRHNLAYRLSSLFFKENKLIIDVCLKNNRQIIYFSEMKILYMIVGIMQMDNTELNNNIFENMYYGTDNRITVNGVIYSINKIINKTFSLKLKTYIEEHKTELTNIINNLSKRIINKSYMYYIREEPQNQNILKIEYESIDLNNSYISNLLLDVNPTQWLGIEDIDKILVN